jgi:hypothetical protein
MRIVVTLLLSLVTAAEVTAQSILVTVMEDESGRPMRAIRGGNETGRRSLPPSPSCFGDPSGLVHPPRAQKSSEMGWSLVSAARVMKAVVYARISAPWA